MKIYVVSCNETRWKNLTNASSVLNLDFVNVQSPLSTDEEVQRRGKRLFETGKGYPTGVAATIGHIRAMKQFVESQEPLAMIVEDDVRFHKDFNNQIKSIEKYMLETDTDIFSLGFVNLPHQSNIKFLNGMPFREHVGISDPWGAQCYVITRKYAMFFSNLFSVDDIASVYPRDFVTDFVIFDTFLGCKRSTLIFPIVIESPDEQTLAGSTNKPNLFEHVNRGEYYI